MKQLIKNLRDPFYSFGDIDIAGQNSSLNHKNFQFSDLRININAETCTKTPQLIINVVLSENFTPIGHLEVKNHNMIIIRKFYIICGFNPL
jgi:hypothetical protein